METALSVYLESFATTLGSREQMAIAEFADALLVIPKTLAVNAAKARRAGGRCHVGGGCRLRVWVWGGELCGCRMSCGASGVACARAPAAAAAAAVGARTS